MFSSNCTDWAAFRDLFESLVIQNEYFVNVEKLHYLKISITGNASSLLKHITISKTNFGVPWVALLQKFNQSRCIIEAELIELLHIPAVETKNVVYLKCLRD